MRRRIRNCKVAGGINKMNVSTLSEVIKKYLQGHPDLFLEEKLMIDRVELMQKSGTPSLDVFIHYYDLLRSDLSESLRKEQSRQWVMGFCVASMICLTIFGVTIWAWK